MLWKGIKSFGFRIRAHPASDLQGKVCSLRLEVCASSQAFACSAGGWNETLTDKLDIRMGMHWNRLPEKLWIPGLHEAVSNLLQRKVPLPMAGPFQLTDL